MARDIVRLLERNEITKIDTTKAKDTWKSFRKTAGFVTYGPLLTPPSANVKLKKTTEGLIYGLSLAPASLSSSYQVCRYRSNTCEANCVAYAGKGTLPKIVEARVTKTEFLAAHPSEFVSLLYHEVREASDQNDKIAVRLNTFSDIPWEKLIPWFFRELSDVQFYDYTKWLDRKTPKNYHLTYSASERTTDTFVKDLVGEGSNVAVVFSPARTKPLPETWKELRVIDGDKTDARYTDAKGVVVGLRAKGSMRSNPGRMVRNV